MVTEVSAVDFGRDAGELLSQVRERSDSVVIREDGKAVAALIDAELYARVRRMQGRFDALSRRIADAHAEVPEAVGLVEIDRVVAQERAG